MIRKDVQNLYAIGHASWYNFFKPVWNWIVARKAEEVFAEFLKDNVDEETSILELGCGTALNLEKITVIDIKFQKYLGLDFSSDMLSIAQKKFRGTLNVVFREKDITALDDIDERFDVIISTWVLSHLQSPADLVNSAQSLLNPGGKMFLIFFSKPKWYINEWFYPFAKYLFRTRYVLDSDIKMMHNVSSKQDFAANITTVIKIQKI